METSLGFALAEPTRRISQIGIKPVSALKKFLTEAGDKTIF